MGEMMSASKPTGGRFNDVGMCLVSAGVEGNDVLLGEGGLAGLNSVCNGCNRKSRCHDK